MFKKIILTGFLLALCSVAALAADFNGKWTAAINTPMGVRNYSYEFHVDGTKLTGKAVDENETAVDIKEGKIDGDNIFFVEEHNGEMGNIRIEYSGKIDGDQIKFTRKVGDFGTDEFVAKRSK